MSSHHIVREKQEPALLILGLDNFEDELLGQLLEWSPTVMVTPTIAEKLNSQGIKVDWIIADDLAEEIQSDVKLLPTNNEPAITVALKYLTENSFPSVNVVTDELNLDDYLPFATKINLVIFNNSKKIYPIISGFSKWKPAGEIVEILAPADHVKVTGLATLSANQFKTTADGFFTFRFSDPYLFLAEKF